MDLMLAKALAKERMDRNMAEAQAYRALKAAGGADWIDWVTKSVESGLSTLRIALTRGNATCCARECAATCC